MEYGRCQNGMKWKISRMELKTIFHTRFHALHLQKKIYRYRCRVVISVNNIIAEVFCFNIYAYYLSTNRCTLVVFIVQTLHHSKYIATCSIDVMVDDFDRFDLLFFYFEIGNLPSLTQFFSSISTKIRICYFIPVSA